MEKKAFLLALILILLPGLTLSAEQEALSLTLEECIARTLKNNLRLNIEAFGPELADAVVARAKEVFLPRFDLSYSTRDEESPSTWWIQGAETIKSGLTNYSFSLLQQIPTGASLSLSLSNLASDTNQAFQLINPYYRSTLRLDLTQPLLKNFGIEVSRKEILIARNNLDISQSQFASALMDTIYRVQEAYWNLVYAIEDFKVKQHSLQLARDLLAKNKKEVEVGKLAPIEVLNAETVVAQREADILQAEALISRAEDVLRNILNLPGASESTLSRIVPLDRPNFVKKEISLKEALNEALANRPEMKIRKTDVESKELGFRVAKNQMLPGLDLTFSYWSPGVSGDRLIYLNDNPFLGIIVGKEPGSRSDSLRDAFKLLYKNWTVGLTLSLPLSQVVSRADYLKARLELEQSELELKDAEKQVLLDVREAVRDIETQAKRVEAYRIARELAERRLKAEEKKLEVGLTTNYFVLEFQEQLANARSLELKTLVDYNLALVRLEKTLGTTLQSRNIRITDFQ